MCSKYRVSDTHGHKAATNPETSRQSIQLVSLVLCYDGCYLLPPTAMGSVGMLGSVGLDMLPEPPADELDAPVHAP